MPLKTSLFLSLVSYGLISEAYQVAANDFPLSQKLRGKDPFSDDNHHIMKLFD
jgi:hypothetical protein